MIQKIKTFYKRLNIKQKLLLLFSVQIIIPLTFMGILFYQNTVMIMQNKCIAYSGSLLKMIELRVNDLFLEIERITDDVIYDNNTYSILQANLEEYEPNIIQKDECYQSLRRICLKNKRIERVILYSLDGKTRYSYDTHCGNTSSDNELPLQAMITYVRQHKGKCTWYTDNNKNLYVLRMLYDINYYKEQGIMILQINKKQLPYIYKDLSTEFIEDISIINEKNQPIIGGYTLDEPINKDKWITVDNQEWNYKIIDDTLMSYRSIQNTDWYILTTGSLETLINKDMFRFWLLFLLIMICTILILSIFSILMALDIIDPINQLVSHIKRFQENKVYDEITITRDDELGYVSQCFNDMASQIDNLLNRVYKEQLSRKESELKALQAQINPHFLFNTLESINWMAQLNNVPDIRDMVTSLGTLIEASIGKGKPKVSLKHELQYIDSYLLIMKNRYGDRLSYESDIDTSLLSLEVPKLILQPLVENAIYHGIDKIRKHGLIRLSIKKCGNEAIIEVTDNGRGVEEYIAIKMNAAFKEDNTEYLLGTNQKSIGLINVNGRLKLFFGKQYGLEVESSYGQYMKIKFKIPIVEKGDI